MTTRNIQFGKSCSIKVSSSAETVYISLKRYDLVRAHSHINLHREGIERFYPTWYGFTLDPADSQAIFEARIKNCLADYTRWAKEFQGFDEECHKKVGVKSHKSIDDLIAGLVPQKAPQGRGPGRGSFTSAESLEALEVGGKDNG